MKLFISVFSLLFLTTVLYAQKPKVTTGDWSDLKGIKEINLVFDYEGMEVIDHDSEEAYLAEKVKGKNEKEAGSGDQFKEDWFNKREESYRPDFIKGFNKKWNDVVKIDEDGGAEYTLEVVTTQTYPGYFVGVHSQPVKLFLTLNVFKADSPEDVIFSAKMDKIQSSTSVFVAQYNEFQRISNGYYIGAQIFKKRWKKKAK